MRSFGINILIYFFVLAIGSVLLWKRQEERIPASQVDAAQASLQQITAEVGALSQSQALPDLADAWREASSIFDACGLLRNVITGAAAQDPTTGLYQGPAAAWHGSVSGPSAATLACMVTAMRAAHVLPAKISINEEGTTAISYSVVGSPSAGLRPY